jgi:hypothetical protein
MSTDWNAAWPLAQRAWSPFLRLREPLLCNDPASARLEGLYGGLAMIRLDDHRVVLNLPALTRLGLDQHPVEVLAHEIGHHLFVPADLSDHGRLLARVRRGLPSVEDKAPLIANLYADLLINDRLQRQVGLPMDTLYRKLAGKDPGPLWRLYLRIYEHLWALPEGTLLQASLPPAVEGDALLGAQQIRSYAQDWLAGAGGFALLCLPYLIEERGQAPPPKLAAWLDLDQVGSGGGMPDGLASLDPDELRPPVHPAQDPRVVGQAGPDESEVSDERTARRAAADPGAGQRRDPLEYGQILRQLGMELNDHEVALRYYRELARPHLVRFPVRIIPEVAEPQAEGIESWQPGEPLEEIDWFETVLVSPVVFPGLTTVKRVYGSSPGGLPAREAVDLDLYVDCSGSMPDPKRSFSPITLAGAIVALSAFRAGARVQATLWSGPGQYQCTAGFVRDEEAVLRVLTGYIGGSTQFPLNVLRDSHADRKPSDRPAHVLVLSDDGIDTILNPDERGTPGAQVVADALAKARGGMSLALNVYPGWSRPDLVALLERLQIAEYRVGNWEQLIAFARAFSQASYAQSDP